MEHKCKTNYRNGNKPVCEACEQEKKFRTITDYLAIVMGAAAIVSFMALVGLAQ